jgi:hypothetical protein
VSQRSPSPARLLAVLAVVFCAVAVGIIVASSGGGSDGGSSSSTTTTEAGKCNRGADDAIKAGYYLVQTGETLTSIAERTCMDPQDLATLNPDLDPLALTAGACVSLVADGCKQFEG